MWPLRVAATAAPRSQGRQHPAYQRRLSVTSSEGQGWGLPLYSAVVEGHTRIGHAAPSWIPWPGRDGEPSCPPSRTVDFASRKSLEEQNGI
jgi:hypothetical protein